MNQPMPAAFQFEGYRINEFKFKQPLEDGVKLAVQISPSGVYFKKDKTFALLFDFEASVDKEDGDSIPAINASMQSVFKFNDDVDEIPEYFYQNSIAIVFPFLRAFISTLTIQANIPHLLLPVANLTYLAEPLKTNTRIED